MTDANARRDRYPGARPFADDPVDQRLFFGRPREAEELFHRVTAESLLVVYGKSGLGKTSLLQAGVFPRLRKVDLLPVPVRLNRPAVAPLAAVREALQQACLAEGIDYEPGDAHELWTLLKTAVLWQGDALKTPVLVLDQFEELFTLHDAAGRRRWAQALGDLLGGRVPEPVRARIRAGERLPFGEGPPAVKVVLSLREDHLGGLEELAGELPPVLESRFRLTALDRDAARAAIVEPGLASGEDLASPPLRFSDGALTELLEFLEGKSGIIEPFQLQVLCRHLEQQGAHHAKGTGEITVDRTDLGGREGMETVLGNFYRDAINALPRRSSRRHARNLCEWGLLSQDGRRLPMEQAEIRRQFRVHPDTLQRLVDTRLLRSEPRLEGVSYELSHDTLAESVLKQRRWRVPRSLKYALLALLLLLGASIVVLGLTERERQRADLAAQRADQAREEAEGLVRYMTFDLREQLEPIGRLDLLGGVLRRVSGYYERMGIKGQSTRVVHGRVSNLILIGDVQLALGDSAGAESSYNQAKALMSGIVAAEPNELHWQRELSVSLNKIGDIKSAQGDLAGALAAYEQDLAIAERLAAADPSNAGWQRDLSVSLNKIGDIKSAQGDLAGALAAYEQSQGIFERLAAADPSNAGWQRDRSVSLNKIGDSKTAQGDLAGALAAYEESQGIAERLAAADPSNAGWQRDRSVSLNKIGDSKTAQGDLAGALAAYEESQGIFERLAAADPSNAGWQRDLAVSNEKVGNIRLKEGDRTGARAAYEKALTIAKRLFERDSSNLQWQIDVIEFLGDSTQEGLVDTDTAAKRLRRALEMLEPLKSAGKLYGETRNWPDLYRQRLESLEK